MTRSQIALLVGLLTCAPRLALEEPTNYLLIGNPGVGKSTILNGLTGGLHFKSGVSFGSGLTYQFDKVVVGPHTYMDTPGLSDSMKRKQAAEAITQALRQEGLYKVFFVITLLNGRVKPEDVTTMRLVLDAAPAVKKYGIIINQVPPREYKQLTSSDSGAMAAVLTSIRSALKEGQMTPFVYLYKRDDDLEGEEDKVKSLPTDLKEFMQKMPGVKVPKLSVRDVQGSSFEEMNTQLERKLSTLLEDKKRLQDETARMKTEMHQKISQLSEQRERDRQRFEEDAARMRRDFQDLRFVRHDEGPSADVLVGTVLGALGAAAALGALR